MSARRQSRSLLCLGGLLSLIGLPSAARGQQSEIAARAGFTGKQLFEHEWKWVPTQPRPVKLPAEPMPGVPAGATRTVMGVVGDGLGPLHNATSCAQCHPAGGASGVEHNVTLISVDPVSPVIRNGNRGARDLLRLFPALVLPGGSLNFTTVVHDRSTRSGYQEIRGRLAEHVAGEMDETWFTPSKRTVESIAKQPVVAGRFASVDFYLSQRNSPALYGLGAIDQINDDRIVHYAKKQAERSNGEITGRFAGKFGWRGQVNSLSMFVTAACSNELGLNQSMLVGAVSPRPTVSRAARSTGPIAASQASDPADFNYVNLGLDMDADEVAALAQFIAELPRPVEIPPEPYSIADTLAGERLFNSIGCVDCHVADLDYLSGMFSDLLLHDMGPDLQGPDPAPIDPSASSRRMLEVPTFVIDVPRFPSINSGGYGSTGPGQRLPKPYDLSRPEQAQFPRVEIPTSQKSPMIDDSWEMHQREWRTPPLWGVADTAPYLHDGRAATLDEAILWHGGEAHGSKDRYLKLSESERELVVVFLSSLRAPEIEAGNEGQ